MQADYGEKPPNIAASLSRAFSLKQNTLLLHSRGVDICRAMAEALYELKQQLVILIDFEVAEIQQINYYLHEIKQERTLTRNDTRADKPEIQVLNKTVREKRRRCYISGGIYALTTQIMLLDSLSNSQDLNPQYMSRVVIRDEDGQILDKYSLMCWLATIMSLDSNKSVINVVSRRVTQYKGDNLERIMRLLFIKKVVVWPFGRSQIHQSINLHPLSNVNIKLNMDSSQEQVHKCYEGLLGYCRKSTWDREQVHKMCYYWLNYNKLDHLHLLSCMLQNSSEYSIWKSNNTSVIELIDKILQISKNCVYSLLLEHKPTRSDEASEYANGTMDSEDKYRKVDLVRLLSRWQCRPQHDTQNSKVNSEASKSKQNADSIASNKSEQIPNDLPKFQVSYPLRYQMHVGGLANADIHTAVLFPAKFLALIEQLYKYLPNLQYQETSVTDQVDLQFVLSLKSQPNKINDLQNDQPQHNLTGVGDGSSNKQNELYEMGDDRERNEGSNKAKQRQQKQQQKQQEQQQKQISEPQKQKSKQDTLQKQNQASQLDLSAYQFGGLKHRQITEVFSQPIPSSNRQHPRGGQSKQKSANDAGLKQQKSMPIQIMHVMPPIQTLETRKSQRRSTSSKYRLVDNSIQESMYICTYSQQTNKLLHEYFHVYQQKQHYTEYVRELYKYLDAHRHTRVSAIMRIIKKLTNPNGNKSAHRNMLIHEHEPILLQQLYLELKAVIQIIDEYSLGRNDVLNRHSNFVKELSRIECRYVDKYSIALPSKLYNPNEDCTLTLQTQNGTDVKFRFYMRATKSTSQLNQYLRMLVPHLVLFYSPNTSLIRHININHSQQLLLGVKKVYALYFKASLQSNNAVKAVKDQDEAFWNIGQERKKLGEYSENAEVRIQQLMIQDQIQRKAKMVSLAAATHQPKPNQLTNPIRHINKIQSILVQRTILVDKRQFKSLLPSCLFYFGFKVIPIFLETADYIISNDVVVEKKSVHTRDLHESLRSGRLLSQVKRMCSKFARPYLLIECSDISYFKKDQFSFSYNAATGDKYSFNVRRQLIKIVSKYPKLNIIWSTSCMQTVKFFIELKKNQEQPDLAKFQPQSQEDQIQILQQKNENEKSNQQKEIQQALQP